MDLCLCGVEGSEDGEGAAAEELGEAEDRQGQQAHLPHVRRHSLYLLLLRLLYIVLVISRQKFLFYVVIDNVIIFHITVILSLGDRHTVGDG